MEIDLILFNWKDYKSREEDPSGFFEKNGYCVDTKEREAYKWLKI